jgi:drug/metabolite transporter (DMT)-like permease
MSSPTAPVRARHVSPYLLLTLAPFFWACNWIIGQAVDVDPADGDTHSIVLFAIVILAPFALPHLRPEWPIVWRNRRVMLLLGIVGVGSHNALAYLGLNYTTAMNGVILNSFIPVMIITLSWLFLRQRLARVQLAGVAVSLTGVPLPPRRAVSRPSPGSSSTAATCS